MHEFGILYFYSLPALVFLTVLTGCIDRLDTIAEKLIVITALFVPIWLVSIIGTIIGIYFAQLPGFFDFSNSPNLRWGGCSSFVEIAADLLGREQTCSERQAAHAAVEQTVLEEHFASEGLRSPIIWGFVSGTFIGLLGSLKIVPIVRPKQKPVESYEEWAAKFSEN